MRIVAILQARLGSTRLPNKILLPLAGRTMLDNIYERVKRSAMLDGVTVAIPRADYNALHFGADATYIPFNDWFLYDGDENDLVGRYLSAARRDQADLIVRVPCDNPCIDPLYIDEAIQTYLDHPFVYYSNTTAECEGQMVDGIGAEVFSISRLRWLDRLTHDNPVYREHPHRYFEECGLLQLPKADVRLDVNTRTDYEFIKEIYSHFNHNRFSTQDILSYLSHKEAPHAAVSLQ